MATNAAGHLPAYLGALNAADLGSHELWLVDNASGDDSAGIVERSIPAARVLRNDRNMGFTGACNRALEQILIGRFDFVLFLNDDTEVTPAFLPPLLAAAADGYSLVAPRTYLAGRPGILDDSAGDFDWRRGVWKRRILGTREAPGDHARTEVEVANLSCLLVPVAAFHSVGLLDDAYFVYYDDTDFCARARAAGFRVLLEPASVVYHQKGATLGGQLSAFGCYYLTRNRPYLIARHRGRAGLALFLPYFLATRAARMAAWAVRGRFDLCLATLRGLRDFALRRYGEGSPQS